MFLLGIMFTHDVIANNNGMMSTFAETYFSGMNGVIETNFIAQKDQNGDFNGIRTEMEPLHPSLSTGMNGIMDVFDPHTDSMIGNEIIVKQKIVTPSLKYSFYFDVNSPQLSISDIQKVKEYASKYKNVKFESIVVLGFADPTGSDVYNLTLSAKRANSVKNILIQSGLPSNNIITQGMGEESESTDYRQSRRVELVFTIEQ